jgi:4-hydroxybenzoate polyprenyltransferase
MTLLQFGLGALNDLVDAPQDRGREATKPVAAGVIGRREAATVVSLCLGLGLLLAVPGGPALLAIAVAGTTAGIAYDLWLKGTRWAWTAFAVGIPLLPVYAWLGATGTLPAPFLILVPTAVVAGAAIALGNGLVDPGQDRAVGASPTVVAIGERRAWWLLATFVGVVALISVVSILVMDGPGPPLAVAVAGMGAVAVGTACLRARHASTRERGWELVAIGLAVLAAGWMWTIARAG